MRLAICIFGVCVTTGILLGQVPYLKTGSIGKVNESLPVNAWPQFKYVPMSEWQGKRVIFLPQPASLRHFGYQSFTGGSGQFGAPTYEETVGKIGTVIAVDAEEYPKVTIEMEGTGRRYIGTAYTGSLRAVAFLDEIDQARKELIGKTLWISSSSILTYNDATGQFGSVKVKKFSPVRVVDVVVGWYEHEPIRLILKSENGEEGFLDVQISGTNVSEVLIGSGHIAQYFLLADPKKTYLWPNSIWDAIQHEKVALGMTGQQVRMSWGEPKSISQTITAAGNSQQWVFGSGAFVYVTHGVVSGIQNEK
jgi:hypothetical protein